MTLRAISRVIVITLVVVVGVAIFAHDQLARSQPSNTLTGTELGMQPAPSFTLSDQSGAAISLIGLRGRPVVLTFLYSHGSDADGITADRLASAAQALGARAGEVDWIAISSDPAGDTPASVASFVTAHHLEGLVHYLVGSESQLAPVWANYGIVVRRDPAAGSAPAVVTHTEGVYVIDRQGRERVFLDSGFDATSLSADLRALLGG